MGSLGSWAHESMALWAHGPCAHMGTHGPMGSFYRGAVVLLSFGVAPLSLGVANLGRRVGGCFFRGAFKFTNNGLATSPQVEFGL